MGCITGARYTMRATLLSPTDPAGSYVDPDETGTWVDRQDWLTGQIVRVWEPVISDDPDTPDVDESVTVNDFKCMARGIVDGGIRAAATTENFDDLYRNIDIINMWIPAKTILTKRDRVTNIRDANGNILWRDEEGETGGIAKASVFNVNGVIPTLDPFNKHISNFVLLERAEI